MLEVSHTDYIYTSNSAGLGKGERTDVKNKYFDSNPGPGTYEPPKGNVVPEQTW